MIFLLLTPLAGYVSAVAAHSALWDPSMWGFNVTAKTFSYDNRPVVPLQQMTFEKWWFHGHLSYPPPDNTFLEVPAGKVMNTEIACDKGATTLFASSPGGNIQSGNNPDVSAVKPQDFTIFSTNHTCVWNRWTDFAVPAAMPACPAGGCICAFFWIHAADAGSEQIFMNGYRCNVTGASAQTPIATSRLARRCGADPDFGKPDAAPWNCTYGAKQPIYWMQTEGNTFFEGAHAPPFYNDLYGFPDGAQEDIFEDSQLPVFDQAGKQTWLYYARKCGSSSLSSSSSSPSSSSSSSESSLSSSSSSDSSKSSLSPSSSKSSIAKNEATLRSLGAHKRLSKRHLNDLWL
ncbi:hypothetical protein DFH11DRAFT_1810088 [Phellopilus nigrolimitatus]|nr:hypothetical protein DFH11DRAFT_1810088 [Phellopilus nigrolimitatus]